MKCEAKGCTNKVEGEPAPGKLNLCSSCMEKLRQKPTTE